MINQTQLAEVHASREVIYSFLSQMYLFAPSERLYTMISELIALMPDINEDDQPELSALKKYMDKRSTLASDEPALREYDLENLRHYTRVFCLSDSVPAAESYYTSREKLMMQESRDEVLKMYRKLGFSFQLESNEPEDHIGVELMFMSFLSMLSKKAIENNNEKELERLYETQEEFLNNHLKVWIDQFVERVNNYREADEFYRPLTQFMLGYIKADIELFA